MLKTPKFWWQKKTIASFLLSGFSIIYEFIANKKFKRKALYYINCPVLCIGNFTMGGNGKTPLARNIAQIAKQQGLKPVILMRGYKGNIKKACLVNAQHKISDIGDEAKLLAQNCDVIVAPKREQAISIIKKHKFNFVILDDGFQSRKIHYDYSLLVVDNSRAFGNMRVFPSGPLRANLNLQLRYSDAIVSVGENELTIKIFTGKFYKAKLKAFICNNIADSLKGRNLYAFCAIGNPNKFYKSLKDLEGKIIKYKDFADHHKFTKAQLQNISQIALKYNLELVTTAKDYIRIDYINIKNIWVIDVDIEFEKANIISDIIKNTIEAYNLSNCRNSDTSQFL